MTEKHYPRIGETCYEEKLPCGLTVRALYKPEFDKFYAVLGVNYGSVDMDYSLDGQVYHTPAGVAHYLEHKMFDLPRGSAMQEFTALGGNPNAFTSYSMTAYYVQTTQNPAQNLRLLLEMVLTPHFTEESVEKERGIIAQEINMYADSPDSRLYDLLFEALFPDHPLRVPIAGSVRSIEDITAQTLQQCYDAFYRPQNMLLCVAGKLPPEEVMSLARAATEGLGGTAAVGLPGDAPAPESLNLVVRRQMDVSMPMFALSFRLPDVASDDTVTELAADMAAELLAGEGSELYQRLYNEGLIDSGFSFGFEAIRTKAMLTASGDSRDPLAVRQAILDQADRMRKEGIDPNELRRLKKSALGRRIRDLDSFSITCYRQLGYAFDGVEYFDFPETFDRLTCENVRRVLDDLVPERSVCVIVEPKKEEAE